MPAVTMLLMKNRCKAMYSNKTGAMKSSAATCTYTPINERDIAEPSGNF